MVHSLKETPWHKTPLIQDILLKSRRLVWLLTGNITLNVVATLLEGSAYALFLMGFAAYDGKENVFTSRLFANGITPEGAFYVFILTGLACVFLKAILAYLAVLVGNIFSLDFQTSIFSKLYDRVSRFEYAHFQTYKIGRISEILRIPNVYAQQIVDNTNNLIVSFLMVIITVGMMVTISWQLSTITILFLGFIAFVHKLVRRNIKIASHDHTHHSEEHNSSLMQYIGSMKMIKVFALTSYARHRLVNQVQSIAFAGRKISQLNMGGKILVEALGISMIVLCILICKIYFIETISLPLLFGFLGVSYRMVGYINTLVQQVGMMSFLLSKCFGVNDLLSDEGKVLYQDGRTPQDDKIQTLSLSKASFAYPSAKRRSIDNISLKIHEGETVAFVGHSGAGKTTLIDLLAGLYRPVSGEILVNGIDLRQLQIDSYRKHFGIVSQDCVLFHDTIANNIRIANMKATYDDIEEACYLSQLQSVINHLPDGLNTVIGDRGHKLSGGERQRLALARALIRDPDILVFDEATSNLDNQTERAIQRAIDNMHGTKTMLIIAHRLSTVVSADRIFVLKEGKLVQTGSHQALLQQDGYYKDLWEAQYSNKEAVLA